MKINNNIQKQIDNKSFNLNFHPIFSHNPKRLMNIGYNKSLETASRRLGENLSTIRLFELYNTLFSRIIILEKDIHNELELISENIIREMYNVPCEIDIKPKIQNQDDIEYDSESQEENKKIQLSPERFKIVEEAANKRIILNSIVNGSSVMIWSSAYYIAKEKLDELNSKLVEAYDVYSAVVNCLLWMQKPGQDMTDAVKQGVCEIDFDNGLKCEGVNFPVLLLETNKVVIDYLICKGIPEDFSEDELKLYYAISDDYSQEIWHNLLSPVIYSDFLETVNTESHGLPKIISKLSQLDYEDLKEIFILIQSNKEQAKLKMKSNGVI